MLVIILLISNALTLFNINAYNTLYAALARFIPLSWKKNSPAHKLSARTHTLKKFKAKTQTISRRISQRTLRNISANLAAIPAESIPVVGAGVIVAITAMDLHDACADLKDMDELTTSMGLTHTNPETQKVCGFELSHFTNP